MRTRWMFGNASASVRPPGASFAVTVPSGVPSGSNASSVAVAFRSASPSPRMLTESVTAFCDGFEGSKKDTNTAEP